MPRRSKNGRGKQQDYKFINLDFTSDQRIEISKWIETNTTTIEHLLQEISDSGYKFSFSRDDWHDCYQASLTHKATSSISKPIYTIRHKDYSKLIGVVNYVFLVMLDGGDGSLPEEHDDLGW